MFHPPPPEDQEAVARLARQMADVLMGAGGVVPIVINKNPEGELVAQAAVLRSSEEPAPLEQWSEFVPKKKKVKIYAWPVVSSRESEEGLRAKYTVFLYEDASLACDCPGWCFHHHKNGGCKHTSQIEDEAQTIFADWKAGKTLPQLIAVSIEGGTSHRVINPIEVPFGRTLDI